MGLCHKLSPKHCVANLYGLGLGLVLLSPVIVLPHF